MYMDRRSFLRKSRSVPLFFGFWESDDSDKTQKYPSVRDDYLDDYGWQKAGEPDLPDNLPGEEIPEDPLWGLVSFEDDNLTPTVNEQTDGVIDTQLMSMVTVRVTELGYLLTPSGEKGEFRVDIDSVAEEVCEEVIRSEMENIDILTEFHLKTKEQLYNWTVGQLPYVGEAVSVSLDYLWETPSSLSTRDGVTAFLAQYYASKTIQGDDGTEYEMDYRGLYADWFYEDDFFAALAFYPEDEDELSDVVLDAAGVELELDRRMTVEKEIIKLLSGVGA